MASKQRGGDKPKNGNGFQEDAPRNGAPAEIGHNQQAWDEAHSNAMKSTLSLDQQIDALMEIHIAPLRKEKSEIKSDVRDRFGTSTKMFNARYGNFRLESEAVSSGDNITLATMKRLYDATPIGGQIDMEEVFKKADAEQAEKSAAKNKATATEHAV